MNLRALLALLLLVAVPLGGCSSSPTPHPASGDDTLSTGLTDTWAPAETEGPDRNNDGVPDCEQAGGTWVNGVCRDSDGRPLDPSVGVADATGSDVPGADVLDAGDGDDVDATESDAD